jgi:hypothetical protein
MSIEKNITISYPVGGNNLKNQGFVYAPYIPVTRVVKTGGWHEELTSKYLITNKTTLNNTKINEIQSQKKP